jgi:hypothetical protein
MGLLPVIASILMASAFADEAPKVDEDPGRGTTVSLEYDRNPGNLYSTLLGGDIALSKKVGLLANYKSDELPAGYGTPNATSFGLGAEDDFTEDFTGGIGGEYDRLPENASAKGFNLGAHLRVDKWRFGISLRSMRYNSDNARAAKRLRDKGIPERSAALDISYRFTRNWKIKGAYTGYSYGGATPAELATVIEARPATSAGLLSAVEGFPKNSELLALILNASDTWDFDLTGVHTTYQLSPNSTTLTLGANCQITPAWGAGPLVSGIQQDGQKDGVIIGLQTSYTWE